MVLFDVLQRVSLKIFTPSIVFVDAKQQLRLIALIGPQKLEVIPNIDFKYQYIEQVYRAGKMIDVMCYLTIDNCLAKRYLIENQAGANITQFEYMDPQQYRVVFQLGEHNQLISDIDYYDSHIGTHTKNYSFALDKVTVTEYNKLYSAIIEQDYWGLKNGLCERYNAQGEMIFQGYYQAGIERGIHQYFYPNGTIQLLIEYLAHGLAHFRYFSPESVLIKEEWQTLYT